MQHAAVMWLRRQAPRYREEHGRRNKLAKNDFATSQAILLFFSFSQGDEESRALYKSLVLPSFLS